MAKMNTAESIRSQVQSEAKAGAGSQGLGPNSIAFPDHKPGAVWEVQQPGHELALIWDASICRWKIGLLGLNIGPYLQG